MRKSTLLWLFLAACCSAVLFHTSQKVTDGRQHLAALKTETGAEEESIRVLQAEWSYLNQPDRLEKLAKEYLALGPMNGRQFAKAQDIEKAQATEAAPEIVPPENLAVKAPEQVAETATIPAPKIVKPLSPPPVAQTTLPKPQIIKSAIAAQTKQTPAAPKEAAAKPPKKEFGDLIKSLGVQ